MQRKITHYTIIGIFVILYGLVATISMINSVAFFDLAHNGIMSWVLAIGFELGAAASLAAIIILDKTNKAMVWGLFVLLTLFQMMANSFHAYVNLEEYMGWIELFGLERMSPIEQKRVLSLISGAILPVVALGFIKSLVDYIRPGEETEEAFEPIGRDLTERQENLHDRPDVQSALRRAAGMSESSEAMVEEPTALANSSYREAQVEEAEEAREAEEITVETQVEAQVETGEKEAEVPLQKTAPAVHKPVAPAKPSQPEVKKMTPANSGGASISLRPGVKTAPVAGSPSR